MALLTREDLLKRDKLKIEKVDLGNGDYVYVRQWTGKEKDIFERSLMKPVKNSDGQIIGTEQDLEDFRAKLAVSCLCDEKGELLLKPEDYKKLSESMKASKLDKIVEVAQRLNQVEEASIAKN
jgi:hypothetical protein